MSYIGLNQTPNYLSTYKFYASRHNQCAIILFWNYMSSDTMYNINWQLQSHIIALRKKNTEVMLPWSLPPFFPLSGKSSLSTFKTEAWTQLSLLGAFLINLLLSHNQQVQLWWPGPFIDSNNHFHGSKRLKVILLKK